MGLGRDKESWGHGDLECLSHLGGTLHRALLPPLNAGPGLPDWIAFQKKLVKPPNSFVLLRCFPDATHLKETPEPHLALLKSRVLREKPK